MNELDFIDGRIEHHKKRLQKAEADYRHAATHGTKEDVSDALIKCQAIRAKLISYIARRDEITMSKKRSCDDVNAADE